MRKVRDFDAELKALGERAKLLQQRKVQQFGELVGATGADALDPDVLAGALLAAAAEKDKTTLASWRRQGAQFFRDTSRKSSRRSPGHSEGGAPAAAGAEQG
ncbi:conjugal transfer protein TraD [Sphingomonas paucimobilis]|uniref:conjugal transfer protein TraD n=1 Tax=Sphingomonas paucimobilis TaxID=13689 RepID=UPI000DE3F859|nr:conjugal transfer protein TraD [Sphingomonas paucimobilis]QBE92485.1 conjugal transfer protein TraD [Sphingomonas paucimobilis]